MSQDANNALMMQLKKHYGLKFDLFSTDSEFFFQGAQRQHNLETLRHLSSFGDMALFLTGDKGSGKTTLLKTLNDAKYEGLNVVYLACDKIASQSTTVFSECARALGGKFKSGSAQTELLPQLLKESHRLVAEQGVRTLLAFDEADKLSKKELQVLFSFCRELASESALVMLFSGSNVLLKWSKLSSNLEQSAWCHQIQLKPFSQADVHEYLEQALSSAQATEELGLAESQLQQLSELGKGLPGRINKLFPSVVLEPGALKLPSKKSKSRLPLHVLFGLLGLLLASFAFVSYQHGLLDRITPVFSLEDEQRKPAVSEPSVAPVDDQNFLAEKRQQEARLAMLDSALKEKGLSLSEVPPESSQKQMNTEQLPVQISRKAQSSVTLNKMEETEQAELPKGQTEKLSESVQDVIMPEPIQKNAVQKQKVQKKKVRHKNFKSKEWLVAQSSSSYMAQILGSYQEQTAQKFIKKIGKQKFDVFYLETEYKGKPWFVVFYGVFAAKTHAQNAVKNSPKAIRSQNPWIRSVTDVLVSYPSDN